MNTDNELFELCKEAYERTGWLEGPTGKSFKKPVGNKAGYVTFGWEDGNTPLYTSDFLLEKLPKKMGDEYPTYLTLDIDFENEWTAHYSDGTGVSSIFIGSSDLALKALLKLTIALDDAGELK